MLRRNGPNERVVAWTDDQVADLKKLWLGGQSARVIAAAIGHPATRSAIIGKAHRLGLPSHVFTRTPSAAKGRPEKQWSQAMRPVPKWKEASERTDIPEEDVPGAKIITLRGKGECAWPVGGARFCCAPNVKGQYCKDHAPRAFLERKMKVGGLAGLGTQSGDPERWFG